VSSSSILPATRFGLLCAVISWAAASFAAAPERDPAEWPFSPSSPWNTPLGSGAVIEPADSPCSRMLTDEKLAADINAAQWSHPIYQASSSDPEVKIIVHGEVVAQLRVPRHAAPALPKSEDSDAHLHIIDPERRYVHEMWHASRKKSDVIVAEGYSKNDLHGSGVGEGGERAYGGSAIAGLVRRRELSMGIRHALAMALPRTHLKLGPIWPATKQDDGAETTYRGTIPMGQLVTLAPKTNIGQLGLSPEGRAVAEALRDYGAYVVDASDLTLYAEPSAEPDLTRLRQDLPKLRMLLRCVQNASREAVGGPGTRLAPSAPALRPPLPPAATFAPSGKPAAKSAKPAKSAATAPKGTARQ
jgi:hypothetical protein